MREIELDAVSACAVAVVVSEEERTLLASEVLHPRSTLHTRTMLHPLPCYPSLHTLCASQVRASGREPVKVQVVANAHEPEPRTRTAFAQRRGLVFVGNFNHLPNRDAVLHFATEVLHPVAAPPLGGTPLATPHCGTSRTPHTVPTHFLPSAAQLSPHPRRPTPDPPPLIHHP